MVHDTLLTYPDFNETLKTHNDASIFKLGEVIRYKGKTIDLYSRKFTDTQ